MVLIHKGQTFLDYPDEYEWIISKIRKKYPNIEIGIEGETSGLSPEIVQVMNVIFPR